MFDRKVTVRLAKQLVADVQVMPIRALPCSSGVNPVGDQRLGAGVVASDRRASPP